MSHFVVLVAASDESDLEEIMAPYDEGTEDPRFLEFESKQDEVDEDWANGTMTKYKNPATGEMADRYDDRFRKPKDPSNPLSGIGIGSDTHIDPAQFGFVEVAVPYKEIYPSVEDFVSDYHGYKKRQSTGEYGYFHNQNAKWDWWQIGGRYTAVLSKYAKEGSPHDPNYDPATDPANIETCWLCHGTGTRDDEIALSQNNGLPAKCNSCDGTGKTLAWNLREVSIDRPLAGEIDWAKARQEITAGNMERYDNLHKIYAETKVSDIDQADVEHNREAYNRDDTFGENIRRMFPSFEDFSRFIYAADKANVFGMMGYSYMDVEQYIKPRDEFAKSIALEGMFFGFVDLEGKWHERAEMGWWAVTTNPNDTYGQDFWAFVESLDPKQQLYVVDCHI